MSENKVKKTLERVKDTIPFIATLATNNLKKSFDENIQGALDNTSGLIGIAARLFGQQLIDNYFEKLTEKKLESFGLGIYIKSAFDQIQDSLKEIENDDLLIKDRSLIINHLEIEFQNKQENIENTELTLSFIPKSHPAVQIIKETFESLLFKYINKDDKKVIIDSFVKNFNENIEKKVKENFGEDYDKHIEEVGEKWSNSREGKLINEMISLKRIGFTKDEDMKYQETFGYWKPVEEIFDQENLDSRHAESNSIEEFENSLFLVNDMIDVYFPDKDNIKKMLFIVSDFGKGKSVFLKQYAAQLAKLYQQRGEGEIPIYFNLRNFDEYDQGSSYGVISDYLAKEFGIDVEEKEFQNNQYFFLIDSLDECGSLTEEKIDKVVKSIQKIQDIKPSICRQNKIIVTSRPIQNVLTKHLNKYNPYKINNREDRPINQFISIYGFKKEQFNDYLTSSLNKISITEKFSEYTGISELIINAIKNNEDIDIYDQFIDHNLLTYSELRRPIFSYMLYKLIGNNTDISNTNKVGIYLSFVNVLTKEAKHVDSTKEINLKDEFKFRNILHSTSALWMYENHSKGSGFLKREDISNTIASEIIDRNDQQKVKQYEEVEGIKFLSQSYFGQNGDTFYFQHQSFAEILLAEYYLKIFIFSALSETATIDECRIRLLLGNPTEQTIDFLSGLLQLLKESVSNETNPIILKTRKLLFPMLASLCTPDYSKRLYSESLNATWFKTVEYESNSIEPDESLLTNWVVTDSVLKKIIDLSKKIIESKSNYLITNLKSTNTSLYKDEVIQISDDVNQIPPDVDRWLALLVGNRLYNNDEVKTYFSSNINNYNLLLNMLKNWNYYSGSSAPRWGLSLFKGINIFDEQSSDSNSEIHSKGLVSLNLSQIDFSYSNIASFKFNNCILLGTNFSEANLVDISFTASNLHAASFKECSFKRIVINSCNLMNVNFNGIDPENIYIGLCSIHQGINFPYDLLLIIIRNSKNHFAKRRLTDFGGKIYLSDTYDILESIFSVLIPFLEFIINNDLGTKDELKKLFITDYSNIRELIDDKIQNL
ncbi:NACHT domain-containing protein [Paenibacillus kyungheensis]